jgi:hypothetical protein
VPNHQKVDEALARGFLDARRIAVVGASDDSSNFGRAVYRAVKAAGRDVVAVHPTALLVDGDTCYPSLAAVPDRPEVAILMVGQKAAADVVRDCAALGITKVWLFQGIGSPGSVSDEALELCQEHGLEVVAGACPLMFVEPVGWFHRIHRSARHLTGSLERAS